MEKALQLAALRERYIQLSRQYLDELKKGKTVEELSTMLQQVKDLLTEMEKLENGSG